MTSDPSKAGRSMPTDDADPSTSTRRWRLDDRYRPGADPISRATGRRAVVAIVVAVLLLWLGLDLSFRAWKARYQALATFGATQIAPLVDPLAGSPPPDVSPGEWTRAVADTHAMLLALTAAGVLGQPEMDDLRRDIAARVAIARPETARATLTALWDDMEKEAGPLIAPSSPPTNPRQATQHPRPPRPTILGPSKAKRVDRLED